MISTTMEKKYEEFVFKKKDLEILSDDGTRYFINPEKDVCLYKIPYRPDGDALSSWVSYHDCLDLL